MLITVKIKNTYFLLLCKSTLKFQKILRFCLRSFVNLHPGIFSVEVVAQTIERFNKNFQSFFRIIYAWKCRNTKARMIQLNWLQNKLFFWSKNPPAINNPFSPHLLSSDTGCAKDCELQSILFQLEYLFRFCMHSSGQRFLHFSND